MKKLCVLLLLLSLLLGCVGCGADHGEGNTTPIATDPPAETTPTVTEPPLDTTPAGSEPPADTTPVESTPSVGPFAPVPPYMLLFDSYEEIRELREMIEADEATLREYISVHYPSSMDIFAGNPKKEIRELFNTIGNWYLPYVDPVTGYHSFAIGYYYHPHDTVVGKHFRISYGKENKLLVGFTCTVKEDSGNEAEDEEPIAFTMSIGGQTVPVYQSSFNHHAFYCTVYSTNMRVMIHFPDSDPVTIKNTFDGKIEFFTLNELMGY